MKNQSKIFAVAVTALAANACLAQSAGNWMIRGGAATIAPQVSSGNMSAPSLPNTQADVSSDTEAGGGLTYMYTDHISFDLPVFGPFKHDLSGAGSIAGVGKVAQVNALPATLFVQYRFMEPQSAFRPYVGFGPTYAYFYNATGSGALTALTNPGGTPTTLSVDSQWTYTVQIGATYAFNNHWFADVFYAKTPLKTTTKFSSGQTQDITLDPVSYGLAIGYKF
jgi:outer membrane protein